MSCVIQRALPNICHQPGWRSAQGPCNLYNVQQAQVAFTAFDPTYVSPMQIGFFGQPLLGQSKGTTPLSYRPPKLDTGIWFHV